MALLLTLLCQILPLFVVTYTHECPEEALCAECRKRPAS